MTDIYDRATEAEERFRGEALERARSAIGAPTDWERLSAKWCEGQGCGDRIPDERRRAIPGVKFCVGCQERREEEERRGG